MHKSPRPRLRRHNSLSFHGRISKRKLKACNMFLHIFSVYHV